jgi:CxxC motif-containing protein (DUF1111 family)
MKKYVTFLALLFILFFVVLEACRKPEKLADNEYNEWLSGGAQTVFNSGSGAFSQAYPTLNGTNEFNHGVGDGVFGSTFVSAPAPLHQGLGPLFNSVSCASCHIADGRGQPPALGQKAISLLFRISVAGQDEHGGPMPVPGFGVQLQPRAIAGTQQESDIDIQYTYQTHTFPDGETYELRTPLFTFQNPYMVVPSDMLMSPRIATPVFGMGLIEAIPEWKILSNEDIADTNGDGISGKANYVWDVVKQKMSLGRFGWKAGTPSVLQQAALAFNEDIGITNTFFKNENGYVQSQNDNLHDDPELSDSLLQAVAFYIKTLAVPARRNVEDAQVKKGKQIFGQAKCVKCHIPMSKTDVNVAFPDISNQIIFPYSDFLLHDMGQDLADNRPDYLATGREWKTRPLWGIGLTKTVNGHTYFLHDGRARNFTEAIMWHGGEATQAQQYFFHLSAEDRNAVVKFLESL